MDSTCANLVAGTPILDPGTGLFVRQAVEFALLMI